MKSLKYVIASLVLAVGFAAPIVNAQDAAAPKQKQGQGQRGDMTAALLKGITLTSAQQTQVDSIKADTRKQVQALSKEDRQAGKGREILQQGSDKIRAVLTPDQQTTFDANKKAMQHHGDKGGKDKGNKAPKAPATDSGSGGNE